LGKKTGVNGKAAQLFSQWGIKKDRKRSGYRPDVIKVGKKSFGGPNISYGAGQKKKDPVQELGYRKRT